MGMVATMAGSVLILVLGLVVLTVGAEALIRGAVGLAGRMGVSALVIGLTVVSFGTSSPELAVSLRAALGGQAAIGVGNVVGSNSFNVLFVLGLSALVTPLVVDQKLVRMDVPLMIGVSLLVWALAWDGMLGRVEGVLLVLGIVAYTWSAIRVSRRETAAVAAEYAEGVGVDRAHGANTTDAPTRHWRDRLGVQLALVGGGIGLCVLGAGWLVDGAIAIARTFGVSEFVIGVTIVAAGTSLPEAATSVVAAIRGQRDIAVGNVVGSNLFNLLAILGLCASVAPGGVPVMRDALILDFPVMIGAAIACLPICFTHHEIRRTEGALLLAAYAGYIAVIVWRA